MATFIKLTGFILSLLPFQVLEKVTHLLGNLLILIPNKRKRIILSNLKYAFPEWEHERILDTGRISAARMFELGFFSLTYPFFSNDQKKRVLLIDHHAELKLKDLKKQNKPVVMLVPHVCLFEALAVSPFFRPRNGKRFGAIYRPNRNPSIDRWIKESRLSINIDVFSRDSALWKSKDYLKDGNWLAVLFDQNSGIQGCHGYFLNRFASITTMPDLFVKSAKAKVVFAFPRRISFFKTKLEITELNKSTESYSFSAHSILEKLITNSSNGLPEWLWVHERWKTQVKYQFHLRQRHKREHMPDVVPRTTKFWIRMPNWLGDVVMVFPLLDAIRRGRPDASITVFAKKEFEDILKNLKTVDDFKPIPGGRFGQRLTKLKEYRAEFPSLILNFANSFRSDLECFLIGATRRYGLTFPGRHRPFLTHSFRYDESVDGSLKELHQVKLWEKFLQYFGLIQELNFDPIDLTTKRSPNKIGILPGSANNPSKRWPISNWKKLIELLLNENESLQIFLYGSCGESLLAKEILEGFSKTRVINKCGETNLRQLAEELGSCSKVIGNDSGGMHLSNAVGTPSVVLFGPTNPTVTSPCFNAPLEILQAPMCKKEPSIKQNIGNLSATRVFRGVQELV